jgi:hypothetical protein
VFELLASFFISDRSPVARAFEIALRLIERLRRERGAGREWRERTEGVGLTRPNGRIVVIDREKRLKGIIVDHGERTPKISVTRTWARAGEKSRFSGSHFLSIHRSKLAGSTYVRPL